jgi:hypothetical protein
VSYYGAKGDFYTGRTGYYRGDPGFFSSLGGLVKGIAGGVLKSYTGIDITGGGSPSPQPSISAAGSAGLGIMGPAATVAGRSTRSRGRLSAAAAQLPGMIGKLRGAMASRPGMGMTPHPATYARSLGGRRRHRMNVCNPRALRRAIRRAKGFEKLALRSIRLVSPHRLHGKRRGGFKVSRRRK